MAGFEPATPCLQSIGLESIRSIHHYQLLTYPTNRGTCFSLKANCNVLKTIDSCTVGAQWISIEISETEPLVETKLCITLRQPGLVLSVVSSFEGPAIVREKSLPSGGKPGRKN